MVRSPKKLHAMSTLGSEYHYAVNENTSSCVLDLEIIHSYSIRTQKNATVMSWLTGPSAAWTLWSG